MNCWWSFKSANFITPYSCSSIIGFLCSPGKTPSAICNGDSWLVVTELTMLPAMTDCREFSKFWCVTEHNSINVLWWDINPHFRVHNFGFQSYKYILYFLFASVLCKTHVLDLYIRANLAISINANFDVSLCQTIWSVNNNDFQNSIYPILNFSAKVLDKMHPLISWF